MIKYIQFILVFFTINNIFSQGILRDKVIKEIAKQISIQEIDGGQSVSFNESTKILAITYYNQNLLSDTIRKKIYTLLCSELDFFNRLQINSKKLLINSIITYDMSHLGNPLYKEEYRDFEKVVMNIFINQFSDYIKYDNDSRSLTFVNDEVKVSFLGKDWASIIEDLSDKLLNTTK